MAGIMDMLNAGLGGLNTPVGQLGIQMLMNSGYQQGNPGFGQRLGQALGGMQQMQAKQQQLEYMAMLRKQQQDELKLRQQVLEQQTSGREAVRQMALNDPNFMANNPTARAVLAQTGDMGAAVDLSKLTPVQKPPTMPGVFERRNPDGTVSQQIYNPQTGGYDAGPSYTPPDVMRAQSYVAKNEQEMQFKPQEMQVQEQQARSASDRVKAMMTESARKSSAAALKNRVSLAEFGRGYRGATTQLDDSIKLVDDLLKPDSGLDRNFGVNGWIPNAPGSDASDARAKLTRLTALTSLSELARLKELGVVLTPVSNVDLTTTGQAALAFDKSQSADAYRQELKRYRDVLVRGKQEAATNYNELVNAYGPQTQQAPQGATVVRTGTAPDGRKVIQYSDGRIEYGN